MPHLLDTPQTYTHLDPSGMRHRIGELPDQCQAAWSKASSLPLPSHFKSLQRAVVLGMGGSAIGGDLASDLAYAEGSCPIAVCRHYNLPPGIDQSTLVIASSYSGNTEETLSAFSQALATPAKLAAITSGGALKEMAQKKDVPLFLIDYRSEPRTALAHSFIPLLVILQQAGLTPDRTKDIAEAVQILRKQSTGLMEESPIATNSAKALALKLHQRIPVIYGSTATSAVARRWKAQINENAKSWAFYEVWPELHHNAVLGYRFPKPVRELAYVILLSARGNDLRLQLTQELLSQEGVSFQEAEALGESALAQMLSLIFLGDWTSYYLAILNGVDPSPVPVIDFLKSRLKELKPPQ